MEMAVQVYILGIILMSFQNGFTAAGYTTDQCRFYIIYFHQNLIGVLHNINFKTNRTLLDLIHKCTPNI